jgi:hypothetical protein
MQPGFGLRPCGQRRAWIGWKFHHKANEEHKGHNEDLNAW